MKLKTLNLANKMSTTQYEYKDIKNDLISDVSICFSQNKGNSFVVTKKHKPYYIFTAPDVVDVLITKDKDITVKEYIKSNPKHVITINENKDILDAHKLMKKHNVHHLIVTDNEGNFKYVINYYDIAYLLTNAEITDEMTNLYNERFFEFIISKYKSKNIPIGIIFADLNDFKNINDIYGHLFGNKIIIKVAEIIKQSIRSNDYAFRIDIDKFAIIIFADNQTVEMVTNRIDNKINDTEMEGVILECAVGYAHYPTDSNNMEKVINIADKRMRSAKKRKKS